jgi:hypothetical protein
MTIILSIIAISFALLPLARSPIKTVGITTALIVSIPGILTIISTIVSFKNKIIGPCMFLILSAIINYFVYTKLLNKEYLIIAGIFLLTAIVFFMSRPKENKNDLSEVYHEDKKVYNIK